MLAIAQAGAVDAQDEQERIAGSADEFRNSCASCHGADGRGAGFLTRPFRGVDPGDLTQLSKNNDGARRSTMDKLATASVAADRVLVFSASRRSYLDDIASEPVAPGGNPETNLREWEELRMLALNRVYRMAPVQELLLGIVTKRDCLGKTVDMFPAPTT